MTSDAAARPGAGATRPPAVAGLFYPADADDLRAAVDRALAAAPVVEPDGRPRAVIAPHAGYRYSGATAGAAYRAVAADAEWVERVAVVGPAHRVPVGGVGVGATTAARWETPLGPVDVDVDAVGDLVACGLAVPADEAHAPEHSVEVHLPFLQRVLPGRPVVPLVVGRAPHVRVAAALERLWDDRTLVVVSSDLSHYLDEATARARDERTRRAILEGRHGDIGPYDACGCVAIGGLLVAARPRPLVARTLAMTTSAAASGDTSRVVGYGSFALAPAGRPEPREAHWLLARARSAIAHELATGEPDPLDDDDVPERLRSPGCSFVTLEREGELAGCIGTLQPSRPLWRDVARNARGAAFADPRFPQLAAGDLDRTAVKVALLSALEPLPATRVDLLAALRPGTDGLVLASGERRAAFLPSVWRTLVTPERFVSALLAKAGLDGGVWPSDLRAWRYTTTDFVG